MDVHEECEREITPEGKEVRPEIDRDAVEEGPQEEIQPAVDVTHEREGDQELLAELLVGGPRFDLGSDLNERQRIDEAGFPPDELDIERRCVLQDHAARNGE